MIAVITSPMSSKRKGLLTAAIALRTASESLKLCIDALITSSPTKIIPMLPIN